MEQRGHEHHTPGHVGFVDEVKDLTGDAEGWHDSAQPSAHPHFEPPCEKEHGAFIGKNDSTRSFESQDAGGHRTLGDLPTILERLLRTTVIDVIHSQHDALAQRIDFLFRHAIADIVNNGSHPKPKAASRKTMPAHSDNEQSAPAAPAKRQIRVLPKSNSWNHVGATRKTVSPTRASSRATVHHSAKHAARESVRSVQSSVEKSSSSTSPGNWLGDSLRNGSVLSLTATDGSPSIMSKTPSVNSAVSGSISTNSLGFKSPQDSLVAGPNSISSRENSSQESDLYHARASVDTLESATSSADKRGHGRRTVGQGVAQTIGRLMFRQESNCSEVHQKRQSTHSNASKVSASPNGSRSWHDRAEDEQHLDKATTVAHLGTDIMDMVLADFTQPPARSYSGAEGDSSILGQQISRSSIEGIYDDEDEDEDDEYDAFDVDKHLTRRSLHDCEDATAKLRRRHTECILTNTPRLLLPQPKQRERLLSLMLLRALGVIPWSGNMDTPWMQTIATWYQWFILLVASVSGALSIQTIAEDFQDDTCDSSWCLRKGLLCDTSLAFGSTICLAVCIYHQFPLMQHFTTLRSYAKFGSFDEIWLRVVKRDAAITLLIWSAAVAGRAAIDSRVQLLYVLHLISFAVSSLLFLTLAFLIVFFCRGLMCCVDSFCIDIMEEGSFEAAVPRWNSVQAILRKTSSIVHELLIALQMSLFSTCMMLIFEVYQSVQGDPSAKINSVLAQLPGFIVLLGASRIFFLAAQVTDKCTRVPSLINACVFGPDIDSDRQYLVEYILHSEAGFYVFQIRLTSNITVKFAHVCGVAMFAIGSQILL